MKVTRNPRPFLTLAAAATVVWAPALFGRDVLFYDILFKLFQPYAAFFRESALRHELPFWNPHILSGLPFLAVMQSAVFYPFTWLYIPLEFPAALAVNVWAHTLLAAGFMAALALELGLSGPAAAMAGLGFALNGFFVLHYVFPCNFQAYVWLPLVVLLFQKGQGRPSCLAGAALALALQVFAGHPQFVLYTGLALGVAAACAEDRRRAFLSLAGVGLLAAGIAAVQLVPTWRLAAVSRRAGGLGYDWAVTQSLAPRELLVMLAAPLWNRWFIPSGGDPHIIGLYFGLPLLALAGLGARRAPRPYVVTAALGLGLSLGGHLPLYRLLCLVVRPLAWFRFPAQATTLTCFGVAMLAGFGMDRLRVGERTRWLLVSLCALDLWLFSRTAIQTISPEVYRAETPTLAFLRAHEGIDRFMLTPKSHRRQTRPGRSAAEAWLGFKDTVVPDLAMPYGLYDVFGYEEMSTARYDAVLDELAQDPRSPWLDLLGVRYLLSFWPLPADKFRLVSTSAAFIYENPGANPKAAFTPGAAVPPEDKTLERGPTPVRVVSYGARRVVLEAETPEPGWLVLADAYDEGWTATVNGAPAAVRRVERILRGVAVGAGPQRVEFSYRPPGFLAAALTSAASLVTALGLLRRRL